MPVARMRQILGADTLRTLRRVGSRAAQRGERAFLVGGTVRDLLLGRAGTDLDVMLVGDALELAAELAAEEGSRVTPYPRFLSATLHRPRGGRLDLAAARRESYARPGALPTVVAGMLDDDLKRRDFTINAMALALGPRSFGRLHDPHGGRADLRSKTLRPLREDSFVEDPTRLFRAVRFAARLGFAIPAPAARWMRAARVAGALETISATRLRREVAYLLEETSRAPAVRLGATHGLWRGVAEGWAPGSMTVRRLQRLAPFLVTRPTATAPWVLSLATMFVALAPARRKEVVTRLAPPRGAARILVRVPDEAVAFLDSVRSAKCRGPATLDRAARGLLGESVRVAGALARGDRLRAAIAVYLERVVGLKLRIDGRDLLAAGVAGGREVARGLEGARAAVLEGRAPDRAAQLAAALAALDIARSGRLSLSKRHGGKH